MGQQAKTSEQPKKKNPIVELLEWTIDRLERTDLLAFKFTLPKQYISPMAYLGVLTFVCFVILGISGALLLFFYIPTLNGAWLSVKNINDNVPFGLIIRNIHYHASNAMVFLALAHMYYNYFSGRYKIKNEIIWVTGVIFGTVTVLEAFTGYDLVVNTRAVLAVSIGVSLNYAAPAIGPQLVHLIFGYGFPDFVIRFYALHIFVVPIIMILLMLVHFPRYLTFDLPVVTAVTGAILVVGGLYPVSLGVQYTPTTNVSYTLPEWYLTSLYAFLRTFMPKFIAGILIPTLFILMFLLIPFVDRNKKFNWKDRPFFTALGVTRIGQIIVTTFWGFYIDETAPTPTQALFVDPTAYFGALILIAAVCFVGTYVYLSIVKSKEATRVRVAGRSLRNIVFLSPNWVTGIIVGIVVVQVALYGLVYFAYVHNFQNLILFDIGAILLLFSALVHVHRYATRITATASVSS
jgi:ubiquinol-cytochrome c reductase cytochrome b subunit